jgi:hypothetical protein
MLAVLWYHCSGSEEKTAMSAGRVWSISSEVVDAVWLKGGVLWRHEGVRTGQVQKKE